MTKCKKLVLTFKTDELRLDFKLAMARLGYYIEGRQVVRPRTAFEKIKRGLRTSRRIRHIKSRLFALRDTGRLRSSF